jgi:hypothetical protein
MTQNALIPAMLAWSVMTEGGIAAGLNHAIQHRAG